MYNFFNHIQYKSKVIIYLVLFLIAFSLVYTSTLNLLLSRIMNVDTSVYISVTQGFTRGHVLYKDIADNKGPLLYFLSVPGFFLGGTTGVWITELIIIFISFLFMYKTALLFTNIKTALLTVFFTSLATHPFYYVNAGTEEYALPFLAISFYIFTKYYISAKIKFLEIVILGISFACSIMLRLNMFPLWAGFCLLIIIESIIMKKYIDILKYIIGFILGILIIFIPIYLYLIINNAFGDFYNYVILGGITRGFNASLKDSIKIFYMVINRNFSFIPLCVSLIWIFSKYKNINIFYFLGFFISYLLNVIFLSFTLADSRHYNLILIPYFIPAIIFISESLLNLFSKIKYKYLVLVFFFCVTLSEGIIRFSYYLLFNFDSNIPLEIAGKIIDDNTGPNDKIINLGWNGYIYPFSKRDFASKYIYQAEAFDHIPGAHEEFISTIKNDNPKIITIYTGIDGGIAEYKPLWHKDIYALLETNYKLIDDKHNLKIFLRND